MQELEVAVKAARKAGRVIMGSWGSSEFGLKDDGSPVTEADRRAEEVIKETILEEFPDHAFLGEETGKTGDSESVWVIDPIDATMNFVRSNPLFSTEIALVRGGEVVLGVSNMPALERLMTGWEGGAFLNGRPVRVSETRSLGKAFVSFGNPNAFYEGLREGFEALIGSSWKQRGFGDAFNYHMLAQGSVDVVCEGAVRMWDVAAVSAIVGAAGGMVTDLQGRPVGLQTSSCVATNGLLHKKALGLFRGTSSR